MSIFKHSKENFNQNSNVTYVKHRNHDDIVLSEQLDEGSLEQFWDKVVQDIHRDPEWFTFADE